MASSWPKPTMVSFAFPLIMAAMTSLANCYLVTIDAHTEECFFDKIETGSNIGVMFQVAEGGFLDIDVKVTGPDGKVLYDQKKASDGKFVFPAYMDGTYTYCFDNKMSTMTPKLVLFLTEVDRPRNKTEDGGGGGSEGANKLEDMILQLSSTMVTIKHEQDYIEVRERIHRAIGENTNSRVVVWACFEFVVCATMAVGQVVYLKRFFEVQRAI